MANLVKLHDQIPTALITPFLRAPVLLHSRSRRFDPFDQRPKGLNLWERQRCCRGTIALCRGACAVRV